MLKARWFGDFVDSIVSLWVPALLYSGSLWFLFRMARRRPRNVNERNRLLVTVTKSGRRPMRRARHCGLRPSKIWTMSDKQVFIAINGGLLSAALGGLLICL
jgi:hypothetical protein